MNAEAYFAELEADIAENGGLQEGQSVEDAFIAAHERRKAFAQEIRDGLTERAKMARRVLAAQVYHAIRSNEAARRVLQDCSQISEGGPA